MEKGNAYKAGNSQDCKILYRSTNGSSERVDFGTAMIQGQAPDRGLYMPERIPVLPLETIAQMKGKSYPEIAFTVLSQFLQGEIPASKLVEMVEKAYDFDIPLQTVVDGKSLLWLDGGPTLSFKDLAARMMALLMQYYLEKENKHITLLVATSGDTGSAIANAFHGLENITVVILFPIDEVTELQRKQMTTLGGNVIAIGVHGKFDHCQALAKAGLADIELRYLNPSSANSISIGRLLPQMIQHFYAYSRAVDEFGREIVISVPCGNFGHITAGLLAKRMGLPVHRFVAATNANKEFPEFVKTCVYNPIDPSINCISNAMNVGHPSNLARIIDLEGGVMDEKGKILTMPDMEALRRDFFAVSISDAKTKKAISKMYDEYGIILDPHGAVGWAGLKRYLSTVENWSPCVSFETANPGKFPKVLRDLGIPVEIPRKLADLEGKSEKYIEMENNYEAFKALIKRF